MIDLDRMLRKMASNLWFEWNADVHLLFRSINSYIWSLFRSNLYRFLKVQEENPLLYRRRLLELLRDQDFVRLCEKVDKAYKAYLEPGKTMVSDHYPELINQTIAYFSMEYGLHILRIYSGGLGILSGDHLRGASDVGLKMVGVGLFYLQGYYEQQVLLDGTMKVSYEPVVNPRKPVRDFLPLEAVKRAGTSDDLVIEVPLAGRVLKARVWRVKVGRAELMLLDTNIRENGVHDRHITRRLYSSQKYHEEERRRRLEQELLLGIGGVRALEGSGYQPSVYHLNEGHVGFAALEVLLKDMRRRSLSLEEVRAQFARRIGFTTHTPVPEGNERFDEGLVRSYLQPYLDTLLNPAERETIFNCARNRENMFDMTKLSLLLCEGYRNGVSVLHGEVCRRMWGYAWGKHDSEGKGVPIGSITNAVHVSYWQKPNLRQLIESSGGLKKLDQIEDAGLWALHLEFKNKLIEKVRERFAYQLLQAKLDVLAIHEKTLGVLESDSFMIGFARRFADYKRVTMLLENEERLFQFLERGYQKYHKPIHILYAGKPHPNNYAGRDRIRYIVQLSEKLAARAKERGFRSQLIFVQGYDIELARYLVPGVDIWLNNPIRSLEASGTSGMKAGMNGVLNVSIADGWVPEGIQHGQNGWIFGRGDEASTAHDRDELFKLLEHTILPLYFDRDLANPISFSKGWVAMMRNSIRTLTAQFNTDRMMQEYIEKMYLPALTFHQKSSKENVLQYGNTNRDPRSV